MELEFVKDMFDAIALRYDLLNRLLSLRQDVYWRRTMVSALNLSENDAALDVACGTGDVMIEMLRRPIHLSRIVGVDFSTRMLHIAKTKLTHYQNSSSTELITGNGLCLPFAPRLFNAVTIAFGIRNIMDRKAALTEFFNMLKPGGKIAVLELTTPENKLLQSLYLIYFRRILPKIGALFSKHLKAYTYLPESVIHFPKASEFANIMRQAGFIDVRWRFLSLGVATLFIGIKS